MSDERLRQIEGELHKSNTHLYELGEHAYRTRQSWILVLMAVDAIAVAVIAHVWHHW